MQYLGKRKMYQMALDMLKYKDMPKCMYCEYKFYRGTEWLIFSTDTCYVKFTVMNCGFWIRVVEKNEEFEVVRDEVLHSIDPRLSWKLA